MVPGSCADASLTIHGQPMANDVVDRLSERARAQRKRKLMRLFFLATDRV